MSHETAVDPTTDQDATRQSPPLLQRVMATATQPVAIVWILLLAMIPLSRLSSPNFPSVGLFESTLVLSLFLVVVAFGQGFVILTGGFDLSLASVVALSAFLTGFLTDRGWPLPFSLLAAMMACATVGAVNGALVAFAKFPAFIVTLATGTILASVLLAISRGTPAQPSPEVVADLFSGQHDFLFLPTPVWVLILVVLVGYVVQMRSAIGARAFAVGSSPIASRVAGLNVHTTLIWTYVIAALAFGCAGVMLLGYSSGADLTIGSPWLLPSIAAVVIGGSAIRGGAGSFIGTVGGALLITIVSICISAAGLSEGVQQIFYGVVILLALVAARFGRSNRNAQG